MKGNNSTRNKSARSVIPYNSSNCIFVPLLSPLKRIKQKYMVNFSILKIVLWGKLPKLAGSILSLSIFTRLYKYNEDYCILFIFYDIYLGVTIRTAHLKSQDNVDTFHILQFIGKR